MQLHAFQKTINMKILILTLSLIALFSCNDINERNVTNDNVATRCEPRRFSEIITLHLKKNFVVVGKAGNLDDKPGGAYITTVIDSNFYFIQGLSSWDEKTLGKLVRVNGILAVKEYRVDTLSTFYIVRQSVTGVVNFIHNANWEVLE